MEKRHRAVHYNGFQTFPCDFFCERRAGVFEPRRFRRFALVDGCYVSSRLEICTHETGDSNVTDKWVRITSENSAKRIPYG